MALDVNCGDTFLLDFTGAPNEHLFVVITRVIEKLNNFVIVGIESAENTHSENLVLLSPGEHPFLTKLSSVSYRFAAIMTIEELDSRIKQGTAKKREPMPPEIVARIVKGMKQTRKAPRYVQEYFNDITWPLDSPCT
ncbi:hypothetical protein SDC9_95639 [bioreactor metagenome]|uniref:Uncharacterized protein n=1 Tax=bioreactor metagenome TaxID=1076179 RepID=A0A645A727_9ZZZZ